jgi:hypothetical protein
MIARKGARFKAGLPQMSFMRRKAEQGEMKGNKLLYRAQKDGEDEESSENSPQIEEAPRKMTLDYLLGAMPQPAQRLKEGKIHKHGMDGQFHERYLVLTADALFLAAGKDADSIKDCIPLCEIVTVKMSDESPNEEEIKLLADPTESKSSFEIQTNPEGVCSGVSYIFAADSPSATREWIAELLPAMKREHARLEALNRMSGFRQIQRKARRLYNSMPVQMTVALLVFLNFIATAAQAEVWPLRLHSPSSHPLGGIVQSARATRSPRPLPVPSFP